MLEIGGDGCNVTDERDRIVGGGKGRTEQGSSAARLLERSSGP